MERVAEGIDRVALRSLTLPPATHTNTYVVGTSALSIFDPASPFEDERARLAGGLKLRRDAGELVERIVLTHHHPDHVAGAVALQEHLATVQEPVPIVAHEINRALLPDIDIQQTWDDGQTVDCGGRSITAHHTPGHAPGHLVFQDDDSAAMIAGDMVAGVGTILIAQGDGDLGTYLDSLQRMRDMKASVLLPAHGPALPAADQVLAFYIAHRHGRTQQIRDALDTQGSGTAMDLVPVVYADQIPEAFYPVAAVQITSHLIWLEQHGQASQLDGLWTLV